MYLEGECICGGPRLPGGVCPGEGDVCPGGSCLTQQPELRSRGDPGLGLISVRNYRATSEHMSPC